MHILGNRVLVSRLKEEKKTEGFETVEVQTDFLYKGVVEQIGGGATIAGTSEVEPPLNEGCTVLFAKYSPHTQSVDVEGEEMKIIRVEDILAVL